MGDVERWCPHLGNGATLITVNQRLARHFQHRYDEWRRRSGETVWETPNIVSWSAWLLQLHDEALCDGWIETSVLSASLDDRLWRVAVETVDTLHDAPVLDKSAAAHLAKAAWLIQHAWHCHVSEDAQVSLDQHLYREWSTAFRRSCHEHHAIDQSRLAPHLRSILQNLVEGAVIPKQLLFAGFLTPTVEQQTWWRELADQSVDVALLEPMSPPVTPAHHVFLDDAAEWRAAASHARALLEHAPGSSIGLIVPSLQAHRTDVLRAFDAVFFPGQNPVRVQQLGRPYDVSLGVSLAEQPVVRSALTMLRFLIEWIPASEVTSLLLSPYFLNATRAAVKRRKLDRVLRDDRRWELSAQGLIEQQRYTNFLDIGLAEGLQKALKTLSVNKQSFRAWSSLFGRLLQKQLGWPGTQFDSLEFQAVNVLNQVIDELEALDDGNVVTALTAVTELQRLCSQRVFQPETPRAPIQIMGRLESHGIAFDHLWITGMDVTQWPPKTAATALIPKTLQHERGVPEASAPNRLEAAQAEWRHWCQLAPTVVASRAVTRDGQPLLPAACVSDLPLADNATLLGASSYPDLVEHIAQSAQLQPVADTHGPALVEGHRVKGGARRLEDQAKCPFRGFALHHLGIKPLEEPGMGLDPRGHGNLLHAALEKFWLTTKTSAALQALDEAQCESLVNECIEHAFDENAVEADLRALERPRLVRLISDWLNVEKGRPVGFTVEAVEQKHEVDDFGFAIKLFIDRIDRLDSGERIIIDYKTGRSNWPSDWALERIESPQLPLYATIDNAVDGVAFAQVAQNDMQFKGVTAEKNLLPRVSTKVGGGNSPETWDEWREHWQSSLQLLATEIREGVATITPSPKACQYCDLKPLCRYRQLEGEGSAELPAGDAVGETADQLNAERGGDND